MQMANLKYMQISTITRQESTSRGIGKGDPPIEIETPDNNKEESATIIKTIESQRIFKRNLLKTQTFFVGIVR